MTATDGHFKSNNHALAAGMLAGALMKHGVPFEMEVTEEGDYTPRLTIFIEGVEAQVAIEVLPVEEDAL